MPSEIDVLPVPDPDDGDGLGFVLYGVYDAVSPLSQPVSVPAGEIFGTGRARILCEGFDAAQDLPQVFLWNAVEILSNRFFEEEAISDHLF